MLTRTVGLFLAALSTDATLSPLMCSFLLLVFHLRLRVKVSVRSRYFQMYLALQSPGSTVTWLYSHLALHSTVTWLYSHMALQSPGSTVTWLYGHLALRSPDSTVTWLYGHLALRSPDSTVTWLYGHLALRSPDSTVTWLYGHLALRSPGSTVTWLYGHLCCSAPSRVLSHSDYITGFHLKKSRQMTSTNKATKLLVFKTHFDSKG